MAARPDDLRTSALAWSKLEVRRIVRDVYMWRDVEHFALSEYQTQLIVSFSRFITDRISNGFKGYYLNFMFHQLRGDQATLKSQMRNEAERFYATVITRIIRNPRSSTALSKLPVFIGCPDLPVWKHEKLSLSETKINNGLHFNGVFLVPAISRLKTGFKTHMQEHQYLYVDQRPALNRIHVKRIRKTPQIMMDYTLKAARFHTMIC
jgi:hypothetical protein